MAGKVFAAMDNLEEILSDFSTQAIGNAAADCETASTVETIEDLIENLQRADEQLKEARLQIRSALNRAIKVRKRQLKILSESRLRD